MLNALGVPLIVGLGWLVTTRLAERRQHSANALTSRSPTADALTADEVAERIDQWAPSLVVAYTLPVLVSFVISASALLTSVVAVLLGLSQLAQFVLVGTLGTLLSPLVVFGWHIVVDALAVAGAVWLARAGQRAPPSSWAPTD